MTLDVTHELLMIFLEIIDQRLSENEWAKIESSDMFQTQSYCGGFDATEMEFCFSYYAPDGKEYWFQLPLETVNRLVDVGTGTVEAREARR